MRMVKNNVNFNLHFVLVSTSFVHVGWAVLRTASEASNIVGKYCPPGHPKPNENGARCEKTDFSLGLTQSLYL